MEPGPSSRPTTASKKNTRRLFPSWYRLVGCRAPEVSGVGIPGESWFFVRSVRSIQGGVSFLYAVNAKHPERTPEPAYGCRAYPSRVSK